MSIVKTGVLELLGSEEMELLSRDYGSPLDNPMAMHVCIINTIEGHVMLVAQADISTDELLDNHIISQLTQNIVNERCPPGFIDSLRSGSVVFCLHATRDNHWRVFKLNADNKANNLTLKLDVSAFRLSKSLAQLSLPEVLIAMNDFPLLRANIVSLQ